MITGAPQNLQLFFYEPEAIPFTVLGRVTRPGAEVWPSGLVDDDGVEKCGRVVRGNAMTAHGQVTVVHGRKQHAINGCTVVCISLLAHG